MKLLVRAGLKQRRVALRTTERPTMSCWGQLSLAVMAAMATTCPLSVVEQLGCWRRLVVSPLSNSLAAGDDLSSLRCRTAWLLATTLAASDDLDLRKPEAVFENE